MKKLERNSNKVFGLILIINFGISSILFVKRQQRLILEVSEIFLGGILLTISI